MDKSFSEIIFWCGFCERYLFFDTIKKVMIVNEPISKFICIQCDNNIGYSEQITLELKKLQSKKNKKNEK
tara:strand:+ start:67 stop:276 length:210 start_codon:yes stop_codon:yes gene_type:complete